jgi:serine/threonine-protein kinase
MEELEQHLASALADRYAIERELGRGGMAVVYLARDLRHDRLVALKVLRPELAATLGAERFLREIRIAAKLTHPHILALHDSGEADGLLFYVMPYIEGESLRGKLDRETQLGIEEAIELTRQVAAALDYAHRQGIIHRDIKPENILLHEGEAVVADFGIARALHAAGGERLTETGLSLGTPQYMSPEQASGTAEVDARSDVYSLACVLYEMLAGDPPFTGPTTPAVIARQLVDPPPSIRTVRPTVPVEVEQGVLKALAKVPVDRYETAGGFVAALGEAAGVVIMPTTERRALERQLKRQKLLRVALPAVVGAVVAVAAVAAVMLWPRGAVLDPNLIAVAPFDVLGLDEELWREAVPSRLIHRLDGAGTLRGVAPAVVSAAWEGNAEPAAAASLASGVGAGLVIFGRVSRASGDAVRLAATLFDATTGTALQAHELEGPADATELSDSLAAQVLTALAQNRVIGAVRMGSLGSTHPLAIKEFLTGEVHYRRWRPDSARQHYLRALEHDSGFALAHQRLAHVNPYADRYGWSSHTAPVAREYLRRAVALGRGLAARESLLLVVDSLWLAGWPGFNQPTRVGSLEDSLHRRLAQTAAAGRRGFPRDPELWYATGMVYLHFGYELGLRPEDARDALANAVWLDSGYIPAYPPLIQFELHLAGRDAARRALDAYLVRADTGARWEALDLVRDLLESARGAGVRAGQRLDSLFAARRAVTGREEVISMASAWLELARVDAGAAFARRGESGTMLPAAYLPLFGYLREARALLGDPSGWPDDGFAPARHSVYGALAAAGTVPPDTAAGVFEEWFAEKKEYLGFALPFWLKQRDTVALRRAVERAETVGGTGSLDSGRREPARGYLLLAVGDTAGALPYLEAFHPCAPGYPLCGRAAEVAADVHSAQGRLEEAEQLYSWLAITGGPFVHGHAEFALGRLNEQLDNLEKARWAYGAVIDRWRNADPELQPYVEEARAGLARLGVEPDG